MKPHVDRRRLLVGVAGAAGLTLAGCAASPRSPGSTGSALDVGLLLAGRRDDRGFMEAGWRGLERARSLGAWVVTPPSLGVGLLEFHQFDRMVQAGRLAARALLEETGGDFRRR